ncbi:MAG: hypothetical protein LBS08_05330 [Candidatus Symbiothrix sp.]|jgi:hypothetical protein|nr:hypothetical protein [Candidatus Symbiothrix sp.]
MKKIFFITLTVLFGMTAMAQNGNFLSIAEVRERLIDGRPRLFLAKAGMRQSA